LFSSYNLPIAGVFLDVIVLDDFHRHHLDDLGGWPEE
jgi:hypothetical protein